MQDQKEIQFASQRFEQKIQTHAKGTVLAKLDEIDFMSSIKTSKSDLPVLYVALKQFKGVIK